jgi:transposase
VDDLRRDPRYVLHSAVAEGKTPMEAMRCVKRRHSDVVYRQLVADAERATKPVGAESNPDGAGPGGHPGTTTNSSVAGLTPDTGTSDQPQPEPAPGTLATSPTTHQPPGSGNSSPDAR